MDGDVPLTAQLPGYGRPLNYAPAQGDSDYVGPLFPNVLNPATFEKHGVLPLTTLREFTMLQLMNSITDKVDWNIKINNPEIAIKWKEEALSSGSDITTKMVDWCLDELRYKASLIPEGQNPPPIVVYNGDVVKSNTALSADFKFSLQNAVKAFEGRIPAWLKDWHPGSDKKVWDLVHPSLYPLVYGRTRILENGEVTGLADCINRCGKGNILDIPDKEETIVQWHGEFLYERNKSYSRKFQWLPCEVDISQDASRLTSYINNLHPLKEKPLYNLIEKLIDACIPLWDLTLAPHRPIGYRRFTHKCRIEYHEVEYMPIIKNKAPKTLSGEAANAMDVDTNTDEVMDIIDMDIDEGPNRNHESDKEGNKEHQDSEEQYDSDESEDIWGLRDTKAPAVRPEPTGPFSPLPVPPRFSLKEQYRERGLQVIVKLANIELTPEKPEYEGGSWHIEGQMNEHIVATAIYYYSSSNITTSSLSFRQWFNTTKGFDVSYPQFHKAWLPAIFGCQHDGLAIQEVGNVETCEGRLLTFPNILQHRVNSFKLADPTRPGHRKIVALFLVDPNIKIISTAHVPCQRQDWWWEASQLDQRPGHRNLGLPTELKDYILDEVDFPLSLREAKKLREDLMEKRKAIHTGHIKTINDSFYISLCEH